jgi:TrpR-related protein YerC/YecD
VKNSPQKHAEKFTELFDALLKLRSAAEYEHFLGDLCTPAELTAMADRWAVAKLLSVDMPYRKIYEQTGISTATVTRVARAMNEGVGYQLLLNQSTKKKSQGRTAKEKR